MGKFSVMVGRARPGLAFFCLFLLGACQSDSNQKSPSVKPGTPDYAWDRQRVIKDQDPLTFTWNEDHARCENAAGELGNNANRLVQCGSMVGVDLSYSDVRDQDLRGLQILNCRAEYVRFDGSDLRHARFQAVLKGSRFQDADLRDVVFDHLPLDYLRLAPQALKGAKFDHRTATFPLGVRDLEKMGGSYISPYPQASPQDLQREDGRVISFEMDHAFSAGEKQMFLDDLYYLHGLDLEVPAGSAFEALFGSGSSARLLQFLDDRFGYVLARTSEAQPTAGVVRAASNAFAKGLFDTLASVVEGTGALQSSAQNYFNDRGSFSSHPKFADRRQNFEGKPLSTRTRADALVILQARYTGLTAEGVVGRLATLIHEARHSDCDLSDLRVGNGSGEDLLPALFSAYDSKRERLVELMAKLPRKFNSGRDLDREQLKVEQQAYEAVRDMNMVNNANNQFILAYRKSDAQFQAACGQEHADCPANLPNKDYRGAKDACDSLPWGSYAVGALFAKGIGEYCKNCGEHEKQQAIATWVDHWSRLLYDGDRLLQGEMGPPNLRGI